MSGVNTYTLQKNTFYLNGLSCANCAAKIETAIKNNITYEEVNFSFATKKLQLSTATEAEQVQVDLQSLVDSIEEGVTVSRQKVHQVTRDCHEETCDVSRGPGTSSSGLFSQVGHLLMTNKAMVVGSLLVFTVMLLKPQAIIAIPAYVLAYLLIGHDVVLRALKNLIKGNLFDEYFLMSLATVGAMALGEYSEAVMVMFFYKIGEGFQDYAVDHSRRSIQSLLNIKAEYANLLTESGTMQVAPESLKIGDRITIKAGEKVPVDGQVLSGFSTLDTSALTGESLPQEVSTGQGILSGSINIDGVLVAEVTKVYEDSTVAKILDMVENATGKKAKTEQFITKFARVYTPIVVVSALLLAFVPTLLGFGDLREWISRALIFLVISCPCALVLSVPLGYFGGLGVASRKGILIKGGNYLEALNQIDTYVFDKTGTLTKGEFAVREVTDEKTLELAALLEVHSNHPIAKSIVIAYGGKVSETDVSDIQEHSGQGLVGTYKGHLLAVGNQRLMERYGIEVDASQAMGSVVYVAYQDAYVGKVVIADEIKASAYDLANQLKAIGGQRVVMLTGDQEAIAGQVAGQLKLDGYHSQLLPQDKMAHVEDYIASGKKVLFVGDGINDAPVLARADIGVAMGGVGSDAAIEAADIVLMTDDPSLLIEAKAIAKKTRLLVMQNIVFALGIKVFFLALGAIGIATMYEADRKSVV